MTRSAVAVCAAAGLVSGVSAQVVPTGPFTGEAYEGFEGIAPPGSVQGPVDIFGGQGTMTDSFAGNVIITTNLISFLTNEEIFPWNGNLMGMTVTGFADFTFDTPATSFGGYIGTVDVLTGGTISFYDEGDNLIETLPMQLPVNDWQWWGWSSSTPFSRISIDGNVNPGTPIVFDDLNVSFVPAPASAAMALAAAALIARRRRD